MNHRLTRVLVGIVATIVVVAAVAFGLADTGTGRSPAAATPARPTIPQVMHPVNGTMAGCVRCHGQVREGPHVSHRSFGASTCLTCHRVVPGRAREARSKEAGAVPHGVALPYDDCVGCHAIGGNRSMPADHENAANGDCADCHTVAVGR